MVCCPVSQLDVATDNLLDFEDHVNVVVESNGNVEEDQPDNHMHSETSNSPVLVRTVPLPLDLCCSTSN